MKLHPLERALRDAPVVDEPLSDEDRLTGAETGTEAQEDIVAGRVLSHEELKRSFGLDGDDLP